MKQDFHWRGDLTENEKQSCQAKENKVNNNNNSRTIIIIGNTVKHGIIVKEEIIKEIKFKNKMRIRVRE